MNGPSITSWCWVAVGGALGALTRYAVSGLAARWFGAGFPWGTLTVNVVGCFAIGIVLHGVHATALPEVLKPAVAVGLLGGLTTFSSFGYETWEFLEAGRMGAGIANLGANLLFGLTATAGGLALARQWWPVV